MNSYRFVLDFKAVDDETAISFSKRMIEEAKRDVEVNNKDRMAIGEAECKFSILDRCLPELAH